MGLHLSNRNIYFCASRTSTLYGEIQIHGTYEIPIFLWGYEQLRHLRRIDVASNGRAGTL